MAGKILILDDVATNRIVMKVRLAAAGYHPAMAADPATAAALTRAEAPDLALVDLGMSGADVLALIAGWRADPATRHLPVIALTASADPMLRARAFDAGADEVLVKPVDDQTLLALIRSVMRRRSLREAFASAASGGLPLAAMAEPAAEFQQPARVALICARPETALRLRRDLSARGNLSPVALTADEALMDDGRRGPPPEAFVIEADLAMAGGGLRLMSELQSRPATRHAAFVMLLAGATAVAPAMAYDLGAHDLITGETPAAELGLRLDRVIARKRADDRLRALVQDGLRLAVIDPLTGLHNRRYAVARLAAIAEDAARRSGTFAVMIVDLDRFKSVNDRWGHAAGDAVLVEVAARLGHALRQGDLLARIGGEEFLAALPGTGLAEARVIAERLCHVIKEQPVTLPCGTAIGVTVSVGLAIGSGHELRETAERVRETVDRADRALLDAKSAGRNKVTISLTAA